MSSESISESPRTAGVIGLGLIGGSVAMALRDEGWRVWGADRDVATEQQALDSGVIDSIGIAEAAITIVCTPVDSIVEAATAALTATSGVVIDTGSVKAVVAEGLPDPRFIPTHPMAGSEQSGLDGARPDLFRGASWVLTPDSRSTDADLALVYDLVGLLGADPLTLSPSAHDRMVATVSHVPHLTAAALMTVADRRSSEHAAMLRLAAGGFRDMTRIAAGSPDIWPPICLQNGEAIGEALEEVIAELTSLREAVANAEPDQLRATLVKARAARQNLPGSRQLPPNLAEIRVRIKDEEGELATLTSLAAEASVNIFDIEIAHSAEGPTGVIVLLVDAAVSESFAERLREDDYRPSVRPLS